MIRPVMHDVLFLNQKSEAADKGDLQIVQDLMDTLQANAEHCVGMAANMIGVRKRIIAVNVGIVNIPMINPVITRKSGPYEAEEGCLSLSGVRKTRRFEKIEVEYLDLQLTKQKQEYTGWTAQIIQHEIDHCDGILI